MINVTMIKFVYGINNDFLFILRRLKQRLRHI